MSVVEAIFGKRKTLKQVGRSYIRAVSKANSVLEAELVKIKKSQEKTRKEATSEAQKNNLPRVRTLAKSFARHERRIAKIIETKDTLEATKLAIENAAVFQTMFEAFCGIAVILSELNRSIGPSGLDLVLRELGQEHAMSREVERLMAKTASEDFDEMGEKDNKLATEVYDSICKDAALKTGSPQFTIDDDEMDGELKGQLDQLRALSVPKD
jgi:hypothetical protein